MELLKKVILERSTVQDSNVLRVGCFLNHQIDPYLMKEIGHEFARRFEGKGITKILTIESSGIAPALFTGYILGVPVVFAKKCISNNLDGDLYDACVYSYTKARDYMICVSSEVLSQDDKILIIDDFLANGRAVLGLNELLGKAGAELVGVGIVIEKGFQYGGQLLRDSGFNVQSLAIIESMSQDKIVFKNQEE